MFHDVEQTITERTAAAVRAELARHRVSYKEMARVLGCGRTSLWRRLNGTYPFDLDQLDAIAAHLGVPVSALLPEPERAA